MFSYLLRGRPLGARSVSKCAIAVAAIVLLCGVDSAHAAQRKMSLTQLTTKADHIVVGEVIDMHCYEGVWQAVGPTIFTDVTLRIEEEWKGKVKAKTLTVRVPGGELADGRRIVVSGMPKFTMNEKCLVFTRKYEGTQWVFGHMQGKYRMKVKRVVSKFGFAIDKDILTHALKPKIEALIVKERRERKGR